MQSLGDHLRAEQDVDSASQSVEQLKKLYNMYKDNLSDNLKSKKHIIIEVTTTYKEIKQ